MKAEHGSPATTAVGWSEPLYDVEEVGELLRCGRTKVFELLRDGHLTGVRVGRRRLISGESVRDVVRKLNAAPES